MARTHKTNIKIITLMLFICYAALIAFACSCSSAKKSKTKTETKEVTEKTTNTIENEKIKHFDFSTISIDGYTITLEPIDPVKEMKVTTPAGTTTFQNTKPTLKKETKRTENNITTQIEQAKTEQASEVQEVRTNDRTLHKEKKSIPWGYLIALSLLMLSAAIFIITSKKK